MWSWHWSPLTQTSLLLSPSDGLASFLKTTLANGVKVVKKVITGKFRFHFIAIHALGCFRNFSCTPVPTKITLKSPHPRETCLWRPCLLMDRDEMSNHYRGPPTTNDGRQAVPEMRASPKFFFWASKKLVTNKHGRHRQFMFMIVCFLWKER
jgi:hypothetical protein